MSKIHATTKEKAQIAILLNQHCFTNTEGFAVYADGWDDRAIAKATGCPEAVHSVQYIRKAMHGNLAPLGRTNGDADYNGLLLRIIAIENKLGMHDG